jgi:hypothetical protein
MLNDFQMDLTPTYSFNHLNIGDLNASCPPDRWTGEPSSVWHWWNPGIRDLPDGNSFEIVGQTYCLYDKTGVKVAELYETDAAHATRDVTMVSTDGGQTWQATVGIPGGSSVGTGGNSAGGSMTQTVHYGPRQ